MLGEPPLAECGAVTPRAGRGNVGVDDDEGTGLERLLSYLRRHAVVVLATLAFTLLMVVAVLTLF